MKIIMTNRGSDRKNITRERDLFGRFFRFLLATVSVFPNGQSDRRYKRAHGVLLCCCYVLSLIGQTMHFARLPSFQETMYTLLCILEQMFMALNAVYFEKGKRHFERMIGRNRMNSFRYSNPLQRVRFQKSIDRRFQRDLLIANFAFLYVCYALHIIVPLFVFLLREQQQQNLIIIEADYSDYLAVPFWFPYRINSFGRLVISSLIELFVFLPFIMYNFGAWLFVVYFMMEIRSHKNALIRTISAIDRIPLRRRRIPARDGNFDARYRALLSCYDHYISITKFAEDLSYCYRWFFQSFVLCTSAVLPILGYLIIVEVKNISLATRFLVHALVFIPHLYLFCFIGHGFMNLKTEFRYGIYANINWYAYPLDFQKTLLIMFAVTHNEVRLKYGVKYVASFELFANILKSSYSYTNLLLKVN